ncbi:MAG: MBL fold metallo-hydrolase [Promethearchaeota archaeon]
MSDSLTDFELLGHKDIIIAAGQKRLLFDPIKIPRYFQKDRSIICVSHAHSDHTAGLRSSITKFATPETLDIYKALGGRTTRVRPINTGDTIQLSDDVTLTALHAGHMLGAVQFAIERNNTRLVYTGDFNLNPMLTTEKAKCHPCDILLIEATYGRPQALFPPLEKVYAEIVEWISHELKKSKIPAFQVYATGKAQEIIRLINKFLTIPVIVDSKIAKVSGVYRNHNIPLEYHSANSKIGREIIRDGGFVYLSSRRISKQQLPFHQRIVRAVATGWAQIFPMKNADKAFVLSAHADFQQLLQYVHEAKPKAVYLTHGDTITFGAVLDKLKIKRVIPHERKQLRLSDFL